MLLFALLVFPLEEVVAVPACMAVQFDIQFLCFDIQFLCCFQCCDVYIVDEGVSIKISLPSILPYVIRNINLKVQGTVLATCWTVGIQSSSLRW